MAEAALTEDMVDAIVRADGGVVLRLPLSAATACAAADTVGVLSRRNGVGSRAVCGDGDAWPTSPSRERLIRAAGETQLAEPAAAWLLDESRGAAAAMATAALPAALRPPLRRGGA